MPKSTAFKEDTTKEKRQSFWDSSFLLMELSGSRELFEVTWKSWLQVSSALFPPFLLESRIFKQKKQPNILSCSDTMRKKKIQMCF